MARHQRLRAPLPALLGPGGDKNAVLNTSGTIDGLVNLYSDGAAGSGNAFTNAGLITFIFSNPANTPGLFAPSHFVEGSVHPDGERHAGAPGHPGDGRHDFLSGGAGRHLAVNLAGTLSALVQPGLYANSTTYFGVVTCATPASMRTSQRFDLVAFPDRDCHLQSCCRST